MTSVRHAVNRTVQSMAMDFVVHVEGLSEAAANAAIDAVHEDLEWANSVFSLWNEDSQISRYGRGELLLDDCVDEMREVLAACEYYREASHGAFDARRFDGVLDPTGLVKGWAVMRAAEHLDRAGAADWFVGGSGDVWCKDGGAWRRLGIADPREQGDPHGRPVVDVVEMGGRFRALATSGGANHPDHLWDPATGQPAKHVMQVSVVGPDLVECDVFATAIAAAGERAVEPALKRAMEVLVITGEREDGTLSAQASSGWPSVPSPSSDE